MSETWARLDKLLASHGFGSRRDSKKLLHRGLVLVNGEKIFKPEMRIDLEKDTVLVDGEEIIFRKHIYLMLHKPENIVSSTKDGLHKTVLDLIPEPLRSYNFGGNLHPIGRLDIDTEGLILLTTDGSLTHRLTSPKKEIPKTYFAQLNKKLSLEDKKSYEKAFALGFKVIRENNEEAFFSKPAKLLWLPDNEDFSEAELTITEGKYHQVKRMFRSFGTEVLYLKRLAIGSLELDMNLEKGSFRELTDKEVEKLF